MYQKKGVNLPCNKSIKNMSNKTILSALNAQLETKSAELNKLVDEQQKPQLQAKKAEVLAWLRENVSSLIPAITIDIDRLEINKSSSPKSGWSASTVYINTDWRTQEKHAKFNWYSSSATLEDKNELNDVQIFGALAANLAKIEFIMINEWTPALQVINAPVNILERELSELNRSIRDIETKIADEIKNSYTKVGFELQFKKSKVAEYIRSEDGSDDRMELVDGSKLIELKTGRGRWDYVHVHGYKVIGFAKGKYTLECFRNNDTKFQMVVSEKNMNLFINDVYQWENIGCDKETAKQIERYNKYSTTKA